MDSAGGVPMDKGTNSSESTTDKSVSNEEAPVSFNSSESTMDESVSNEEIPLYYRSFLESMRLTLEENEKKRGRLSYTPLSFFYTKSTAYHPCPKRLDFSRSLSKIDTYLAKFCNTYIPLSFFTTFVSDAAPIDIETTNSSESKMGPMCEGNNSSESNMMGNKSSDTKVSRNSISDQVALSILSKLSVKSLKRFGCVRKSWSVLFENSDFMTLYTKHFISRHASDSDHYHTFILSSQMDLHVKPPGRRSEFHLLDNGIKVNLPPIFQQSGRPISILGSTSVKGIFCLGQDYRSKNEVQYALWNPATQEFLLIPHSPAELRPPYPQNKIYLRHVFHGFGYDQVRDDFKVIQYVSFDSKSFFEIYSLKSNSWRMIDMDNDLSHWSYSPSFAGLEVYLDGACHWLVSKPNSHRAQGIELTLLSFDLSDEVFLTTPIGEEPRSPYTFQARLAVLNGSIALISNYDDDIIFHISILGELGVSESWIKLYIYGPLPSIKWPPIGLGKTGYLFCKNKDDELVYVDLKTQIIEEVDIYSGMTSCFMVGLYLKSLLSIGGSIN